VSEIGWRSLNRERRSCHVVSVGRAYIRYRSKATQNEIRRSQSLESAGDYISANITQFLGYVECSRTIGRIRNHRPHLLSWRNFMYRLGEERYVLRTRL
jgi:hypothetical protein